MYLVGLLPNTWPGKEAVRCGETESCHLMKEEGYTILLATTSMGYQKPPNKFAVKMASAVFAETSENLNILRGLSSKGELIR
jgi:hypothetical protein